MATCRQTWLKSMQLLDDLCAFDEGDLTTNLRPPPPAKPDAELIEDTLPMPEFFNWCSLAATPDDDGKRSPRPSFFDTNFLLLGQVTVLPSCRGAPRPRFETRCAAETRHFRLPRVSPRFADAQMM
ncbi:unnamed protein product [Durusdinium trenchii]|uniref:Uncharacterized protein n=1 Tax=Durusdinium trenchii TaxID=1381693 RepID=A0ABP0R2E8_9DINO